MSEQVNISDNLLHMKNSKGKYMYSMFIYRNIKVQFITNYIEHTRERKIIKNTQLNNYTHIQCIHTFCI